MATAALAAALAALTPVVVHDAQERSPLASVAAVPARVPGLDPDPRPAAYGRVGPVREDGGAWLQFWLFYADQDQDRGLVRTGRHAGDWEMVQVRVDRDGRPQEAVFNQHNGAERCGWDEVRTRRARLVVFAAKGAHGSYPRPGTRDRTWPDPNDEADGRGVTTAPRLVRITERTPAWMRFAGRWGGARAAWWNPFEQGSPQGPAFQPDRWDDPDAWAAQASGCRTGCDEVGACDGRETALGVGGGVVAALAGAVLVRRRRRRA